MLEQGVEGSQKQKIFLVGRIQHYKKWGNNMERWKYLGSLFDIEEDIKRRKAMATATYKKLMNVLERKPTSRIQT